MWLFDFFKKDNNVYAPIRGKCLDISHCVDKVFASKMIGDGFIIKPKDEIVCSPANGIVSMIFPTAHAFGIIMENGQEILVHIGVNTVELEGKYFEILSSVNQKVKKGIPIIRFDYKKIEELGYDNQVIVALINSTNVVKKHLEDEVTVNDVIVGG